MQRGFLCFKNPQVDFSILLYYNICIIRKEGQHNMTLVEKRKAKHPDTPTFHYHNANPKNKITTDCVIRALSVGMEKPYEDVVMEMAKFQCETGFDMSSTEGIDRYLKKNGWTRCKQPKKDDGKKYTGKEFCMTLSHPIYSEELNLCTAPFNWHRVIADCGGHHIVAIVEGQIWDTWNSTSGSIGIVWVKQD